jgi:hypothetical protein
LGGTNCPGQHQSAIRSDSQPPVAIVIAGELIANLIIGAFLMPALYIWMAQHDHPLPFLALTNSALSNSCGPSTRMLNLWFTCDPNHLAPSDSESIMMRGQVYTVRVGNKGAWFMLSILAFWAAMPGLACLAPIPQHACCRQMMQDCGPSMAMGDPSCCKVHSSDTNLPPAQGSRVEASTFAIHDGAITTFLPVDPNSASLARMAETPPGAAGAAHNFILRI